MKLAELRRLSITKQLQIHFRLRNGMECVINQDGVAQVPGLKGVPDFNLEDELATATEFLLDPVVQADRKSAARPRTVQREEMARMSSPSTAAASHVEHDDE